MRHAAIISISKIVTMGRVKFTQQTTLLNTLSTSDAVRPDVIWPDGTKPMHYNDVIMSAMASQITSHTIVYSSFYSGPDQRKHQSSVLLAFVRGIHRRPVNSPHKWPVTRKMFPFDDVIMIWPDSIKPIILTYHQWGSVSLDHKSESHWKWSWYQ